MRKRLLVLSIAVLFLFTMPYLTSHGSLPLVQGGYEADFSLSGDGDESIESITSFSETLADDTFYYPDHQQSLMDVISWDNDDDDGGVRFGDITSTSTNTTTVYPETSGVLPDPEDSVYMLGVYSADYTTLTSILNFTNVPTDATSISLSMIYGAREDVTTFKDPDNEWDDETVIQTMSVYNFTAGTWDTITDGIAASYPHNVQDEFVGSDYISDAGNVTLKYYSDTAAQYRYCHHWFFYFQLEYQPSSGYYESFADVSEWTLDPSAGSNITSDGDVGRFGYNKSAAWGWMAYSNTPSFTAAQTDEGLYIEFTMRRDASADWTRFRLYGYESDDRGGTGTSLTSGLSSDYLATAFTTYKLLISIDHAIESVVLYGRQDIDSYIYMDYLRIGPADEMGWQHDCSTTSGTDASSSDGDLINVTSSITFDMDTTATAALVETDYYPFVDVFVDDGAGNILIEASEDGSTWSTIVSSTSITAATHFRGNVLAAGIDVKQLRVNVTSWATVDYAQLFSIANYTLTESSTTINDYLYVSDAVLYSSMTSGTIELNHDPSLSVGDTYSVWNLTTGSTAPEFSYYISSWTSYSSETRGSLSSGTVTDIKLRFDATEDISAITFIEDATAPNIVRSFANPPDPSDDESVTLSAVVTDAVEVYEVYFDAIVSPSGFTDTAYHAAEQTDNLWSYEFSSLTAGHYTFKIIATDGANENSLTEYAYIDLEIRTGSIVISPISFFGVGEDFTQMQMSFEINRDCSYTIYEASASYAISDTHTGSVSEGWSNIAWDKISVDDTAANFSIKFTNGSLSTWVNGSYSIAQTTFYVPPGWSHNGHEFSATVEVSGRITKLATYMIYTENAAGQLYNSKNGTLTTLDFQINFTRTGAAGKWHDFAIQFTNISQTCWLNSTYYIWEHNPDRDEKGGGGSPEWWNDAFWYIGIISVIGLFGIVLLHFRPQGGNLPNA